MSQAVDAKNYFAGAFTGSTVLVTGAGHGFGRAIAHAFAARGANVVATDIRPAGLEETLSLLADVTGTLSVEVLDVSDRVAVQAHVSGAAERFGRLDIVVNNAGGVLGQVGRPIEEVPESDWHAIFGANLDGAFFMSQAAVPHFKAVGRGRIVNISSGAGLGVSLTGIQAYAAAKAGLIGLTRQLAHEFGPANITVNCIAPGFVRSNPTTERQWQSYGPDGQQRLLQNIALRRLGSVDDIANGVLFFASDVAGWVTGQTLSVDGGR